LTGQSSSHGVTGRSACRGNRRLIKPFRRSFDMSQIVRCRNADTATNEKRRDLSVISLFGTGFAKSLSNAIRA
jgi:hypothetical protein